MPDYYHVTRKADLPSILDRGLVPAIGPRSRKQGETVPAVYLFKTRTAMLDAVMNWLGEQFGPDEERTALRITFEKPIDESPETAGYELLVTRVIPPGCIEPVEIQI